MEKFLGLFSGKINDVNKGESIPSNQQFSKWFMRYPESPISSEEYKAIVNEKDQSKRKEMIDRLVHHVSIDDHKSGFFTNEDEISVGGLAQCSFIIDDNEIYYTFFDKIDEVMSELKEKGKLETSPEGFIIFHAISRTEDEYFGFTTPSRNNRLKLLTPVCDAENDCFLTPSISVLKHKGVAECVELAAVAHNLWTLAGIESYFVVSKDCAFSGIDEAYANDGHAFNLVKYGDSYKVFDRALGNYGRVEGDPIKDMIDGKPVTLKGNGIKITGTYANKSKQTVNENKKN